MSAIVLLLSIILGVGLLAALIGLAAYRNRLKRIENGEIRGTHSSIPAPETTVNAIYKIVLMVVAVLSFVGISLLHGSVISLQSQVAKLQSHDWHDWEVSRIYDLLEKGDSRILTYEYECGEANYEEKTASITVRVSLKEYRDGASLTLDLGNSSVALEPVSAGTYAATFDYGLFEPYSEALICIHEDGANTVEYIDFPSPIFYEVLPMPWMQSCSWSSTGKKYEGELYFEVPNPDDIESCTITYMTENRDLKTVDITEKMRNHESIPLEKVPIEHDLATRLEIVTKSGLTLIEQEVVIFDDPFDYTDQFREVRDKDGQTLWRQEW